MTFRIPHSALRTPCSANIAALLTQRARERPDQHAVLEPIGRRFTPIRYRTTTFAQLDRLSDQLAADVVSRGVAPGMRLVLFVPFSTAFIAWTFALMKAGVVVVLIDPGMGRNNIFRCLAEVEPDGFVAIRRVQFIRSLLRRRFPHARFNITVDVNQSLADSRTTPPNLPTVRANDPAAIIFTSGSTGPPKGVVYEHGMFAAQVRLIQQFYRVEPGEIDLPGFPLFGLFNAAMGVTTVIPQMDPTRPARVDPQRITAAIEQQHVTQAFGSPAFWNRVGRYTEQHSHRLPGLQRALSAGGPVPVPVLERMSLALTGPSADLHTPYGATECLPVTSIGAREVLARTAAMTRAGAGTCVGRPFPEVEIAIIAATDEKLASLERAQLLPTGAIGEIIVRSPSVTREYFRRPDANRLAKIPDPAGLAAGRPDFWRRIGDVGYFDSDGLLWFC
ncbi:MAG: fatty acid CoA ligase family protein, partial [Pirellulales bacterium]